MVSEQDLAKNAYVLAKIYLADLVQEFGEQGWGDYLPDISERAFVAVHEAMESMIPRRPTNHEYVVAHSVLELDAESEGDDE